MATFTDHLVQGTYPYLTPEAFIESCADAYNKEPDDDSVLDAVEDASLVVYYLTGRQFHGEQTTTITPGGCRGCMYGHAPHVIPLGLWPVTGIVSIREDGVDQDPAEYHIDEYRFLVKNNGERFPRCANQWAEAGSDGDNEEDGYVFEVTVTHGMEVPRLIKRATKALACEMFQDQNGGECALPERVTSITRQGVVMDVQSYSDALRQGGTGIYEVDLAIQVFNPSKLQSPSFIWSPDMVRGKRRYT